MKACSKCDKNKPLAYFAKDSKAKDSLRYWCKDCMKQYKQERKMEIAQYNKAYFAEYGKAHKKEKQAYDKEYRVKNLEKKKAQDKRYRLQNIDKIKSYQKEWNSKTKEKRNIKLKTRYATDIEFRLTTNLRRRLYNAIKSNWKVGSAVSDLGCSISEFKKYIENQFDATMSWYNYGEWHLDHIIPLAAFDLTNREQFLKACHFTNYQPLWAKDNLSKRDKTDWLKQ